ncbi:septation protein SepH, partial [Jatrophihabitans sp.]|uniref:septation protein SepH n=1 Tax=Jatrophihabitans sp. TaxID=1932789 RepID=UPI002CD9C0FF|nr:septation protein SepH [Jatrophihabitans sp.]
RVTDEARRARARRGGDGVLVPFGELVDSRLARHGVDPGSARWDAFRREDGGWTVTSRFRSHERDVQAKFSFALVNRTVSALDDIAADLLSDRPVAALLPPAPPVVVEPEPVAESADADWAPDWPDGAPPRLTAVPNHSRPEPVRPQEASPAVRPPSRRQKAHTRPVAIDSDDELFDQDAYAQQPWHEPPLPFEAGAGSRAGGPRHRAPRSGDGRGTEPVRLARAGSPVESRPAEPVSLARTDLGAGTDLGSRTGFDGAADFDDPSTGFDQPPGFWSEPAGPEEGAGPVDHPTDPATDPAAASGRRGRRTGDKPRMPSWDDILLGVRHKSD